MTSTKKNKPRRRQPESPFGAILARELKTRAITIKAAAELAGVPANVVSGWLAGAQPQDLQAVQKIARGLGIDFEFLVCGESTKADASNLSLSEIFQEEKAFSGLFKIEAVRLVRRGRKDSE